MMADLAQSRARYGEKLPRILSEFRVRDVTPSDWIDDESNIRFDYELSCSCGSFALNVAGETDPEWDLVFAPVVVSCRHCQKRLMEFDETKDGYDGELGHLSAREPDSAANRRGVDVDADKPLIASVYFMSDVLEDEDLVSRAHDLFGWFQLWRSVPEGREVAMLVDCECA